MSLRTRTKRQIISLLLIFSFFLQSGSIFALGPALPGASDTLPPVPTSDAALRQKEVGITILGITVPGLTLDRLMIEIVRGLTEELADSTIEWINSGFEEGPAFAVNPKSYFRDVADRVAGQYIEDLGLAGLCSPFRINVKNAVITGHKNNRGDSQDTLSCTLSDVVNNVEGFLDGDFASGGWDGLLHLALNPTSNPYGALLEAEQQLQLRIQNELFQEELQLNWGAGFLSTRDCLEYGEIPIELQGDPEYEPECLEYGPTKTPGTLVEGQLQKVFGSEVDQLNLADEFDEILSALIGQLAETVFSDNGIFDNDSLANRNTRGGAERQRYGACFPDRSTGILSEDEITWTFTGGDSNTTVVWSGTDGLSGTGDKVKKRYTIAGPKSAQVAVTRTTKIEGQADVVKTETVLCSNTVEMSQYRPLAAQCSVTPFVLNGFGKTALWTIRITGGSGQLGVPVINVEDVIHRDGSRVDDLTIIPPRKEDGVIILEYMVRYNLGGTRNFSFIVIPDQDPFVRPLNNFTCTDKVQVIPG